MPTHIFTWTLSPGNTTLCQGQQIAGGVNFGYVVSPTQYQYNWTPSQYLSSSTIANPIASPTSPIYYVATMTDINGCSVIDTVYLEVDVVICGEPEVFIPNAFSPNNDGINDIFLPISSCLYEVFQLQIFDRWGNMVFASTNVNIGWDGTYKGNKLPQGAYSYQFKYKKFTSLKTSTYQHGIVNLIE